jgi:DnaK suppressor protein
MSLNLPGVALYPDDLSVFRCSLSARPQRCLSPGGSSPGVRRTPRPFILPPMDTAHAQELLARERARIEHALGQLTPPDSEAVVDPFEAADVGEDMLNEELDEDRAARMREELDAIGRAEERLTEGTYGISVESGEPIPDGRLDAIPWAERTAEEQARYEAGGG